MCNQECSQLDLILVKKRWVDYSEKLFSKLQIAIKCEKTKFLFKMGCCHKLTWQCDFLFLIAVESAFCEVEFFFLRARQFHILDHLHFVTFSKCSAFVLPFDSQCVRNAKVSKDTVILLKKRDKMNILEKLSISLHEIA